jgi:hypothetical protein
MTTNIQPERQHPPSKHNPKQEQNRNGSKSTRTSYLEGASSSST